MKIAILKRGLSGRGGLEKSTFCILSALRDAGHEVTLILGEGVPSRPPEGLRIVSLESRSIFNRYRRFDRLCSLYLAKESFDVILGMDVTSQQTHYRAGNGVHGAYVKRRLAIEKRLLARLAFHLNPIHRYLIRAEKRLFQSPQLKVLFTNSHLVKQEIEALYGVPREKIVTLHNGVEWQLLEGDFERSFPRKPGPFRLLFMGNGYRRKGLEFLLRGLALLPKRRFELAVVGKEKREGSYRHLAKRLGLESQVTFHGPQPHAIPFYQAADALVLPSIYDPFANVTVEALAMGLTVLSSASNGGVEVLTEESGVIVQEIDNPHAMKEGLLHLMERPKLREHAERVRLSVKHLELSNQMQILLSHLK